MKKISKTLLALSLLVATVSANAQVYNTYVNTTAGYQNNNFSNQQGLVLDASVVTPSNIEIGLNTFINVEDSKLLSYGAYIGSPMKLGYSNLTITPTVGVDQYRHLNVNDVTDEDVTAGNVALTFDYKIDTATSVVVQTKYSKDMDSNIDINGPSYTFGITKLF